jgi:hypothetical protein
LNFRNYGLAAVKIFISRKKEFGVEKLAQEFEI